MSSLCVLMAAASKPRVIIVHGNGVKAVRKSNWYAFLEEKLIESGLFSEVLLPQMPDPNEAKRSIWIPHIRSLMLDESIDTIVIGHSSGAVAAMRLLEETTLLGCILISACHTDLGAESERISGYYPGFNDGEACPNPWQFDRIKGNAEWILQFHSADDPFIPREEADYVAKQLDSEYTCFEDKSHFFDARAIESSGILEDLRSKLASRNK
jgi:uncharacterized protein